MTARETVERDPWFSAFRHARRLVNACGRSQGMACMEARIPEDDYMRLDRLYRNLPPVRHSTTRPHEEYGDAELPPALRGLVRTTKSPAPLPADWAPTIRPIGRIPVVEDEMSKGRGGKPPWRRGDPGTPADELSELLAPVEVKVDDGELEDAAAVENTEEEQDQMVRGEWEPPYEIVAYKDVEPKPLDVEFRFDEASVERAGTVDVGPVEIVDDTAKDQCRNEVSHEDVDYVCLKPAHSPLVGHEFVVKGAASVILDGYEEVNAEQERELTYAIIDDPLTEEERDAMAVHASDPAQHEDSPAEPEFEPVEIEPDLPADEPTPIADLPAPEIPEEMAAAAIKPPLVSLRPSREEVEAQKEKGIEQLEEKVARATKEELAFAKQLVKEGYNPMGPHWAFRTLTFEQRKELARVA